MKLSGYLISVVLLAIFAQNIEAKDVYRQKVALEEHLCEKPAVERDLRGVRDVWAKIRESAVNSWNNIKSRAEKTKEKIKIYTEKLKEHAIDLKTNFELKLEELKVKLNTVISNLYGTGELVKQCLKNDKEKLEDIPKKIVGYMTKCIAEEVIDLTTQLTSKEPQQLPMNETKFISELDNKLDLCERDKANVQECLCKVREEINNNFTGIENDMEQNHYESRNMADDIKGTLVSCSLSNLIEATNLISIEIMNIVKCVSEAKEEANPS